MQKTPVHRRLKGYSGCKLELLDHAGQMVVKKTSASPAYNTRLRKQFLKQKNFQCDNIKTPSILAYGYENELFYFTMHYIEGTSLADTLSNISAAESCDLITTLLASLPMNECKFNPWSTQSVKKKLHSLRQAISDTDATLEKAFKLLESFHWQYLFKSRCHGDLTFENILISPSQDVYLIDFLDSFYNSWVMDLAKIFQDLELQWSYRYQPSNNNRDIKLYAAKNQVTQAILGMDNGDAILLTVYHALLLNVLRIFPYRRRIDQAYLIESLQKVIHLIEHSSYNQRAQRIVYW